MKENFDGTVSVDWNDKYLMTRSRHLLQHATHCLATHGSLVFGASSYNPIRFHVNQRRSPSRVHRRISFILHIVASFTDFFARTENCTKNSFCFSFAHVRRSQREFIANSENFGIRESISELFLLLLVWVFCCWWAWHGLLRQSLLIGGYIHIRTMHWFNKRCELVSIKVSLEGLFMKLKFSMQERSGRR